MISVSAAKRNKLSLTVSIQHFSISCEGSSDIQRPQNILILFVLQALLQKWLELSEIHCLVSLPTPGALLSTMIS